MPLKMFIIFRKSLKPLTKMMHMFQGHSWIFELNHIIFEFGNLNTINNLNAQIMLNLNVDHWNNP